MKKVLVIGAGPIGLEYFRIFESLKCEVRLLSRSLNKKNLNASEDKIIIGDIFQQKLEQINDFDYIIIAVQPRFSLEILLYLMKNTKSKILIEKPVGLSSSDFNKINCEEFDERVYVAFNRRWFNSIKNLKKELVDKQTITVNIEFTEHISRMKGSTEELEKWAIANSIHVLDMGLFLFGIPKITFLKNENNSGIKIIEARANHKKITFYFKAYWGGAGNWNISILTNKANYVLNPIENLTKQNIESFKKEVINTSNTKSDFKNGFFEQSKSFLENKRGDFANYNYYKQLVKLIEKLMNYDK